MVKNTRPANRLNFWSIVTYGLALGILLAALQAARYRLMILDHAQEMYFGLIAVLFTVLGIWAGRRFSASRKRMQEQIAPTELSGPALEKTLEKLNITPREYEVLQFIAQGLSNREIAERLFVSLNTIKTHTSNLFAKLDAQRRTQAVQNARQLGLLAGTHPKV